MHNNFEMLSIQYNVVGDNNMQECMPAMGKYCFWDMTNICRTTTCRHWPVEHTSPSYEAVNLNLSRPVFDTRTISAW